MRSQTKVLCLLFMVAWYQQTAVLGQEKDSVRAKPVEKELTAQQAAAQFDDLLKRNEKMKALDKFLKNQGFSKPRIIKDGPTAFGRIQTYRQEGRPTIKMTTIIHDYTKPNSKDAAAIGELKTTNEREKGEDTYYFALVGKIGDFENNMVEYYVGDDLKVQKANSWWTCIRTYTRNECPGRCALAFPTCAPAAVTVVGYIVCIVVECASTCAWGASSACGCNCGRWCRWYTGCFRR